MWNFIKDFYDDIRKKTSALAGTFTLLGLLGISWSMPTSSESWKLGPIELKMTLFTGLSLAWIFLPLSIFLLMAYISRRASYYNLLNEIDHALSFDSWSVNTNSNNGRLLQFYIHLKNTSAKTIQWRVKTIKFNDRMIDNIDNGNWSGIIRANEIKWFRYPWTELRETDTEYKLEFEMSYGLPTKPDIRLWRKCILLQSNGAHNDIEEEKDTPL